MATPTTTFHGPGPTNVFIPGAGINPQATGMMQVEFSRNPNRFNVNKYVQWVPNAGQAGYYPEMDTDEAVRIVNQEDYLWPDGDDAPDLGMRPLRWLKYLTERRAYPFRLGQKTVDNAQYDIIGAHARMAATKAMSDRTLDALNVMTTTANWPDAQVDADIDTLLDETAKSWLASSTTELFIQQSFHAIIERIIQSTGGVVSADMISLVIGPDIAHIMSRTAEVRGYIVNNESAVPFWMNTNLFAAYNLPPQMYGINIIVEDAVRITTRRGAATKTTEFMMGNSAVFLSRVGGLTTPATGGGTDTNAQAPNFSTVVGFVKEDMTVETETDVWNRRQRGRVVDDRDIVLAAPISGSLISDVLSV